MSSVRIGCSILATMGGMWLLGAAANLSSERLAAAAAIVAAWAALLYLIRTWATVVYRALAARESPRLRVARSSGGRLVRIASVRTHEKIAA